LTDEGIRAVETICSAIWGTRRALPRRPIRDTRFTQQGSDRAQPTRRYAESPRKLPFRTRRESRPEDPRAAYAAYITYATQNEIGFNHLARASEYRSAVQWVSWGDRDPHREYLLKIDEWFGEMETLLPDEIARRVESGGAETADRGAVWTYLTTDQPFSRWKREVSHRLPFAIAAYWEWA
jgi:hypothetical protein